MKNLKFKKGQPVKVKIRGFVYTGKYVRYHKMEAHPHEISFPGLSSDFKLCINTIMFSDKELRRR